MQLPLQITFRNMPPSAAIEAKIRERSARLERFHDRIIGCRVLVEAAHRQNRKAHRYHVRVDVTVPGCEIAVTRHPADDAREDMYVAIRDAFDAVWRRLEDQAQRARGEVKRHAPD